MGDIIAVRDLVKRHNDRAEALSGLTFSVEAGDSVAVDSRSGCGRTSLLSVLGGLDRPTSASVSIESEDIVDMPENYLTRARLNKVGFVFQNHDHLNDLMVRKNIELPLQLSGKVNEDRVDNLQETFGISHISNDTTSKLSRGEAQRVAIARAMMTEPSIILAVEPTGNLDDETAENVVEMFQLARRKFGTTIVLTTDGNQAKKKASGAMHLHEGRTTDENHQWRCIRYSPYTYGIKRGFSVT